MNIAIRTDASSMIGSGHLARCLTLADQLRADGNEVVFVCRRHQGFHPTLVRGRGQRLHVLRPPDTRGERRPVWDDTEQWLGLPPEQDALDTCQALSRFDADWLVVDHYGIDRAWQHVMARNVKKIMVIDDLANRKHHCDVLLDQNYYVDLSTRYAGLVPQTCDLLLGPRFALLGRDFMDACRLHPLRQGKLSAVFVFYGGVDRTNETAKAIQAIDMLGRFGPEAHVVVGVGNPHKREVRRLCGKTPRFHYHEQVASIADLIAACDISLGAGGSATWERCAMGIPTVTTAVAEHQQMMLIDLASTGAIWHMGDTAAVTSQDLAGKLAELQTKPDAIRLASNACLHVMAGLVGETPPPVVRAMRDRR